jgi:hypothetical protein
MVRRILLLLFVIQPVIVKAQDAQPELITDRPDQTESAETVPVGTLQIETGVLYEKLPPTDPLIKSIGNMGFATTLLRAGLFEQMELRLMGQYSQQQIQRITGQTISQSGLSDIAIGVKIKISEEKGWLPDLALNLHSHLMIGADAFRPQTAFPDFRFLFSHTLTDNLSLGYNVGMAYDGRTTAGTLEYTASLGVDFPGDLDMFVELYGDRPSGESVSVYCDTGITYTLTSTIQFDMSGGTSLQTDVSDYFISGGLSFRLFDNGIFSSARSSSL